MPPQRILISYFFGDDMIPLGYSCADALRALGHEVHCFNSQVESRLAACTLKPANRLARALGFKNRELGTDLPIARENFKRAMLKQAVAEFRPDWILVIRSHRFVDAQLVAELKADYGVKKVVGWRVDGPLDSPGLVDDAALYDEYFCIHRHGYDAAATGIHFLPVYGMDFARYRNLYPDGPRPYRHEIAFVAGHNPRRLEYLEKLQHLPVEIHGKWGKAVRTRPWLGKLVKSKGVWGEDLVQMYNTAKIVLNVTGWDPALYGGLNMRVFDATASGAFLLTDYAPELDEHYAIGTEIECFKEAGELADKLVYYLGHAAQREKIARRGYEKALRLPTIADRMKTVISTIATDNS
ncbi:MAG: glycosyltransferase [Sulfuricella sp.]|nr:glycosyltransferase [Sulfuricella sp.]